jgi:hypothetical protein
MSSFQTLVYFPIKIFASCYRFWMLNVSPGLCVCPCVCQEEIFIYVCSLRGRRAGKTGEEIRLQWIALVLYRDKVCL